MAQSFADDGGGRVGAQGSKAFHIGQALDRELLGGPGHLGGQGRAVATRATGSVPSRRQMSRSRVSESGSAQWASSRAINKGRTATSRSRCRMA